MARKLPPRIKFYCSPPHVGTLLANLSSGKPRSVRGGDNAVSCHLYLIDRLIAMAVDANDVARIAIRKPNRFKNMRLFDLTRCAGRTCGERNVAGNRRAQLVGIDVGELENCAAGNDFGITGDPAEPQLARCEPVQQRADQ